MRTACILTDSSAQFPQPSFPGKQLVRVIPLDIEFGKVLYPEGKDLKITKLPHSATEASRPRLITPGHEEFKNLLFALSQVYDDILVLLLSNQLSPLYDQALLAAAPMQSNANILVINSQTTSIGLGVLVQMAAQLIDNGVSVIEVERIIRKQIPHIFTLLCIPGLTYLHHAGLLDTAQANVGELLNLFPIFTLEEGRLTPLEKVRNHRAALDFFQEFLGEFEHLHQIALLQGSPQLIQEGRLLKQYVAENFAQTPYSEHTISLALASLTGPRCLGLVVAEDHSHQ